MTKSELKAVVKRVRDGLVFTKVVATRSVKGQRGDSFAGFSASWRSTQEDGGNGVVQVMDEGDESRSVTGMSLQEAVVASVLVAREADLAAYRNAAAGGNLPKSVAENNIAITKSNYSKMMVEVLGVMQDSAEEPEGGNQ
jgi:hypothetical protein